MKLLFWRWDDRHWAVIPVLRETSKTSLPQAWLSTWRHLGDAGAGAREHRHPDDLQRQEERLGRLRQLDLWGRISQRQELYR